MLVSLCYALTRTRKGSSPQKRCHMSNRQYYHQKPIGHIQSRTETLGASKHRPNASRGSCKRTLWRFVHMCTTTRSRRRGAFPMVVGFRGSPFLPGVARQERRVSQIWRHTQVEPLKSRGGLWILSSREVRQGLRL